MLGVQIANIKCEIGTPPTRTGIATCVYTTEVRYTFVELLCVYDISHVHKCYTCVYRCIIHKFMKTQHNLSSSRPLSLELGCVVY